MAAKYPAVDGNNKREMKERIICVITLFSDELDKNGIG